MGVYLTPADAVAGDPARLREAAGQLLSCADRADRLSATLRDGAAATAACWDGDAAGAYRAHARRQSARLATIGAPLRRGASAYQRLAADLAAAQDRAGAAMDGSVTLGLGAGDLAGRAQRVAAFGLANPGAVPTITHLIGEVVSARADADAARDRFLASVDPPGGHRGWLAFVGQDGDDDDDRRGPDENRTGEGDERTRRRQDDDDRGRRREGDGATPLDADWAGRAIFHRYMTGGADWTIEDDDRWTRYMMDNRTLREQLVGPTEQVAQNALSRYLEGLDGFEEGFNYTPAGSTDGHFNIELADNGYGSGYDLLHGTDTTVGGFDFGGNTTVEPRPDGTYQVTVNGAYTWNDKIDPNGQYPLDTALNVGWEVLTLGQADPYDIHITWHAQGVLVLDENGQVLSMRGYPATNVSSSGVDSGVGGGGSGSW